MTVTIPRLQPDLDRMTFFLTTVFGQKPSGTTIMVFEYIHKRHHSCARIEAAVATAATEASKSADVYVNVSLCGKAHRRTKADTLALPALFLDIDVNGSPKKNGETVTECAPNRDAAIELAHKIREPSLIVLSGYGVQPWYLFDEPWYFASDSDRDDADAMCTQRVKLHEPLAKEIAADFNLDHVGQVNRPMRIPGTFNYKVPDDPKAGDAVATVVRYPRTDLDALTVDRVTKPSTGTNGDISLDGLTVDSCATVRGG